MDAENAHETESPAMVAGGGGEKGTGEEKRKTGIASLKNPSPTTEAGKHGVTSLARHSQSPAFRVAFESVVSGWWERKKGAPQSPHQIHPLAPPQIRD